MIGQAIALLALVGLAAAAAFGVELVRAVTRERAAHVAHEVRGALSAVQLALHAAARRGDVPPRTVAALELELRRALAALRPGGADARSDIDLHELLHCQVQTWHAVASAHGARVVLLPGADTPIVRADALRVAQATANVVANAIEHGGGTVEVRTRAVGDRVRIDVTDGGGGLPAPVAELSRRARDRGGERGRGLAIAADAAAACGGRLGALPSPSGARVAIDLPVARSAR